MFEDPAILHVGDAEVVEVRLMDNDPFIIVQVAGVGRPRRGGGHVQSQGAGLDRGGGAAAALRDRVFVCLERRGACAGVEGRGQGGVEGVGRQEVGRGVGGPRPLPARLATAPA